MAPEAPEAPADSGIDPSGDLPAPYQDPFAALGRDLRAVAATLRLRAMELWRRNRQGDLSVPGFWPQALATLFWPALLALALAALIALPMGLARLGLQSDQKPAEPAQKLLTTPLPQARPTAEPEPLRPPELPAASPEPEATPKPESPALALDPLIQLLSEQDPRHLIIAARPQPASGLLELELSAGFGQMSANERQAQAEAWLERSQGLGYGSLRLIDAAGLPLGRQALVGSGMILLDPSI
jgi:hypothetical protein